MCADQRVRLVRIPPLRRLVGYQTDMVHVRRRVGYQTYKVRVRRRVGYQTDKVRVCRRVGYQTDKVRVRRRRQILQFGVYAWSMVMML